MRRAAAVIGALVALLPATASAHLERPVHTPAGTGHVPAYRETGAFELVCPRESGTFAQAVAGYPAELRQRDLELFAQCPARGRESIQAAIDAAPDGGRVLILPGVYTEPGSLGPASDECLNLRSLKVTNRGYKVLTHDQQRQCPHLQNLVAIIDRRDLQVEGLGAKPGDVLIDVAYQKLDGIRADRADGVYLRNLMVEHTLDNAFYVIETDGYVLDRAIGAWNDSYGMLTFATDHGLYTDCEAYGNGDSGLYPGGTADINRDRGFTVPRYAVEIRNCRSHHNAIGYSGTGGDSVWVHDSEFDHNTTGVTMDSLFPDHPGLPQNHALIEHNRIHANNQDYYAGVRSGLCAQGAATWPAGTVCPTVGVPIGTGIMVAGGHHDLFRDNWIYDNHRAAAKLVWAPGFAISDFRWERQWDINNDVQFRHNILGVAPDGAALPNGMALDWDQQGAGICFDGAGWQVPAVPGCDSPTPAWQRYSPSPEAVLYNIYCGGYDRRLASVPTGCDWFTTPPAPGSPRPTWLIAETALLIMLLSGWLWLRRRPGVGPRR
jgi:hypothetical protein